MNLIYWLIGWADRLWFPAVIFAAVAFAIRDHISFCRERNGGKWWF